MDGIKISPIPTLAQTNSFLSGHSPGGGNKNDNKSNYRGQTFYDIYKQILETRTENVMRKWTQQSYLYFIKLN